MVGIFCVSVVVGIPSTVLEALCGFLFGCLGGAAVSTVGKAMGSVLAFVLGRYFLGDVVVVWMRKYPVVHAISLVFAADATSSWQLLFCAQMSYMPLTIKCYMLSMLDVSTMRFVVTNVLCGIPYSAFWSYIGSQAKDVAMLFAGKGKAKTERFVIMGCGIGSGVLGLVAVGFYTKKKLAELQHEVPQLQVRSVGQDDTIDGSSGSCIVIK
ncbi:hypothetical protein H310_14929 [Aphanomyces invadans]|uniref:VTT domain-containing protein n=1 Tax=Aphanomyces invadans TaxID=157072 RepID=A0A024T9F1_9STRA|nr:hypothetical protein H310_14929 [Aphanomyces invadans]ETV90251.1 hypothetical protein H310_14929 [Aphanomyces invadans]|eukprot:XP_008881126.1 hypothetical protein H310_14929 [Aphanomyces invadans]